MTEKHWIIYNARNNDDDEDDIEFYLFNTEQRNRLNNQKKLVERFSVSLFMCSN